MSNYNFGSFHAVGMNIRHWKTINEINKSLPFIFYKLEAPLFS